MVFVHRVISGVAVAVVSIIGMACAQPDWSAGLGLDLWELPALNRKLAENLQRDEAFTQMQTQVFERAKQKERIVEDLIQGKTSLSAAADRLMPLMDAASIIETSSIIPTQKTSLRWKCCLLLAYWTRYRVKDDSAKAHEVNPRLDEELEQVSATER